MDLLIRGNVNAIDRFQRAAYYKAVLQEPKNARERWPPYVFEMARRGGTHRTTWP